MNSQKKKTNFRKTVRWKRFRLAMKNKAGGLDYITNKRLLKNWNLHHLDLDETHYDDLSNEDNFIPLNKQTHEFIHWLWRYYADDVTVVGRIVEVMEKMKQLNRKI